MNYLCKQFTKVSTITKYPLQLEQHNPFFLQSFAEALSSQTKYNKHPYIYMINAHTPYAHVREMQRLSATMQILSNNRPFQLHIYGRNINPLTFNKQYKKVLLYGWVCGLTPTTIHSVCNIEYIKNPIKCSETEKYIQEIESLSLDTILV